MLVPTQLPCQVGAESAAKNQLPLFVFEYCPYLNEVYGDADSAYRHSLSSLDRYCRSDQLLMR